MQQTSIESLLEKYLSGGLTDAERKLFSQLLDRPEHQQQLQLILDKELKEHAFEGPEDEKIASLIKQNVFQQIGAEKQRTRVIQLKWLRVAAAAVFLLLFGSGVYWWTRPSRSGQLVTRPVSPKDPMAPGGNRAVLKLENGTEILLDSAKEGLLAEQGGVAIVKLKHGQLAYRSTQKSKLRAGFTTLFIPRGGQYQVTLADGTQVWLNAASSLHFPADFTGKERRVVLAGEGYFEVAKDPSRPFHVVLNDMDIEVLGTHFNVNGYDDEAVVRTTLLEGKVRLHNGRRQYLLLPSEQASVSEQGGVSLQRGVDTDAAIAWKNGMFYFQGADIQTILRQAARWYDLTIQYEGVVEDRFSGQISRNVNATELLKILQLTGKVQFQTDGKRIVVRPLARKKTQ